MKNDYVRSIRLSRMDGIRNDKIRIGGEGTVIERVEKKGLKWSRPVIRIEEVNQQKECTE
jgi:hypothetical protein